MSLTVVCVAVFRGPLKNEFRVTVVRAQRLNQAEAIIKEIAVRVECEFGGGDKRSSVTQNEVTRALNKSLPAAHFCSSCLAQFDFTTTLSVASNLGK